MGISRLNGTNSTDIVQRVEALIRLDNELKSGRGYTSGRSGVLAYTVPDTDAFDIMRIENYTGETFSNILTLAPTGSMSFVKQVLVRNTYNSVNQDYPITTPILQIFANGLEMTLNPIDGSYSGVGDGTTWNVGVYFVYLRELTDWSVPKVQAWETYLAYSGTVPINLQMKMRMKSTDKGSFDNQVVVY